MPVASEARRLRWRRGRGRTRGGPTIAPSAQHADAQRPLTSPMSSYYESGMAPARHSQEMKSEAREMVATSASWLASGIRLPRGGRRVAGSKSPAAEVAPAPGTTTNGTSTNTPSTSRADVRARPPTSGPASEFMQVASTPQSIARRDHRCAARTPPTVCPSFDARERCTTCERHREPTPPRRRVHGGRSLPRYQRAAPRRPPAR